MLFRLQPEVLVLLIPVLLFALVFHEFSHGWVAYKLGDPTAKHQGRLTLNPLAHLDPFGSMMILFVGFGWAKPVPVDSRFLANPRVDMMKIAFAGPASNLLLAFIGGLLLRITGYMGPLTSMLILFTQINISLAVFNMSTQISNISEHSVDALGKDKEDVRSLRPMTIPEKQGS